MPEGPSLYIIREALKSFTGKTIASASGSSAEDPELLAGQRIRAIRTLGKQLFFQLDNQYIRIHFLMFGIYSINELVRAKRTVRLALQIGRDTIYFYTCSVKIIEGDLLKAVDWKSDIMGDAWNAARARKKIAALDAASKVCDVLLDQDILAGVGNIIKTEVLYRVRLHPAAEISNIPSRKLGQMLKESRNFAFDFLEWKQKGVLKKHLLAYGKKQCSRCDLPFRKNDCGHTKRTTTYCDNCQVLYK